MPDDSNQLQSFRGPVFSMGEALVDLTHASQLDDFSPELDRAPDTTDE